MKSIIEIFNTKSILQDSVNCWLQYALAQPINIDLRILAVFILQYVGVVHVCTWIEKMKPLVIDFIKTHKMQLGNETPAFERA